MPASEISTAIRADQLRAVFRQMPIALAVNLINAVLTAAVLFSLTARPLPLMWFLSVALVTTGRWLLWRAYRRAFPERQETLGWPALAVWIARSGIVLGHRRGVVVSDYTRIRADVSRICHWRYVHRRRRD